MVLLSPHLKERQMTFIFALFHDGSHHQCGSGCFPWILSDMLQKVTILVGEEAGLAIWIPMSRKAITTLHVHWYKHVLSGLSFKAFKIYVPIMTQLWKSIRPLKSILGRYSYKSVWWIKSEKLLDSTSITNPVIMSLLNLRMVTTP